MKKNLSFLQASALALGVMATCPVEVRAQSTNANGVPNGVILIATRFAQDTLVSSEYATDERGPGMATPGDVAMASLLHDHGYSCRLILDRLLNDTTAADWSQTASTFLQPVNTDMTPRLAIMSGSGASADTPPPPPDTPVMMGEHVCLGNNAGRVGSLYMYNGTASSDPNEATVPGGFNRYMKILNPDHPIMQGIPSDAQGRVKIFREPYPGEEFAVPTGGKPNYEYRWCTQNFADAAPGTTVLGVCDGDTNRTCFAVADVGGLDAKGEAFTSRMVHLFVNENGSGGTRRGFLALTEWGRILFVRSAQWAMGDPLQPYQGFRILNVSAPVPGQLDLSWEGVAGKNFQLYASASPTGADWLPVGEDILGGPGTLSQTFDVSAAPSTLFLRLQAIP